MESDRLTARIYADTRKGLRSCVVVATAGTTNTGAIDDIQALADVARRSKAWLHVDAAYGGFFQLTDRGRRLLHGIETAESIVLDPHKGMFLPSGTGARLVRGGGQLRAAQGPPGAAPRRPHPAASLLGVVIRHPHGHSGADASEGIAQAQSVRGHAGRPAYCWRSTPAARPSLLPREPKSCPS